MFLSQAKHVNYHSSKDCHCCNHMNFVVSQPCAALAKEHIHWDEKLKQGDDKPGGDLVCRPEQEERVEHIKQPKMRDGSC